MSEKTIGKKTTQPTVKKRGGISLQSVRPTSKNLGGAGSGGVAGSRKLCALAGAGRVTLLGQARPAINATGKHTNAHHPKKDRNKKGRK